LQERTTGYGLWTLDELVMEEFLRHYFKKR